MGSLLQSTPVDWLGSWFIIRGVPHYHNHDEIHEDDLDRILRPLAHISRPTSFTLAITQGLDYAHFTSYILIPSNNRSDWRLITFNSGYGIYRGGEETINETLESIQRDLFNNGVVPDLPDQLHQQSPLIHTDATITWSPIEGDPYEDYCRKSGSMQCTGDPFCQTWSLLFIYRTAISRNLGFISNWERMSPSQRLDLIHQFILDLLITFPSIRQSTNTQIRIAHKKNITDVYDLLSNFYGLQGNPLF
jgi:hypothetical protein